MYEIQDLEIRGERILHALFRTHFDRELAVRFITEMATYEEQNPGRKRLIDLTQATEIRLDYKDLISIADPVASNSLRLAKTGFVSGNEPSKTMLADLYVDIVGVSLPEPVKAFKSRNDALEWLAPGL